MRHRCHFHVLLGCCLKTRFRRQPASEENQNAQLLGVLGLLFLIKTTHLSISSTHYTNTDKQNAFCSRYKEESLPNSAFRRRATALHAALPRRGRHQSCSAHPEGFPTSPTKFPAEHLSFQSTCFPFPAPGRSGSSFSSHKTKLLANETSPARTAKEP